MQREHDTLRTPTLNCIRPMSLKDKLYTHLTDEVYCKLGVSPIHGIGVFALRDIPKGAYPLKSMVSTKEAKFSRIDLKKVPSTVRKHLSMFCLVEKGRVFVPVIGMNTVNLLLYLNHSKTPNLFYNDEGELEAHVAIARGEEVTIDYDISFDDEHFFDED